MRRRMTSINCRWFSTRGSPFPNFPSEWLSFLFPLMTNARRTCDRYVVDAIYSGISGAHQESISAFDGNVWVLDCTSEVNVSIKVGGQTFPIHPLDLSQQGTDDNGNNICYGTVRVASLHLDAVFAD
jgi:hypothetical protein